MVQFWLGQAHSAHFVACINGQLCRVICNEENVLTHAFQLFNLSKCVSDLTIASPYYAITVEEKVVVLLSQLHDSCHAGSRLLTRLLLTFYHT